MTRHHVRLWVMTAGFALACLVATRPVLALSPELARTCRNMALKAYPYQLPGTGPGNAQNEIRFYRDCLSKNGDVKPPPASPAAPR